MSFWRETARPHRAAAALLLLLMALSGLSEGFGLLLLVPILAVLSGGPDPTGVLGGWAAALGIGVALGPLLAVFVALVAVRSVINFARILAAHRLEARILDGLRERAWSALLNCEWRRLSAMSQSATASLLITDIDRIGYGVNRGLAAAATLIAVSRFGARLEQIVSLAALGARAVPLLGALQQQAQDIAHARPAFTAARHLIEQAEQGRESAQGDSAEAPRLRSALIVDQLTVRFADRDAPALDAVSLCLPAGSLTLISGASGSGKSTLADCLAGLIRPDGGGIAIDGAPLSDRLRAAWRTRVTYVQQEPVFFAGTIRENLRFADPLADDALLLSVLGRAAAGFVAALPDGLETRIGEGGYEFSGGEKQRLALARALLREPGLLILDEPTSALDPANEAAIIRAIAALRGALTIVILGHRDGFASLADQEAILDNGRLAVLRAIGCCRAPPVSLRKAAR